MIKVKRKLLIVLAGCLSTLLVLSGGGFDLAGRENASSSDSIITFEKTFGGKSSSYGRSVAQTRDGGYIIVGTIEPFAVGGQDIYVVKTDLKGNKIWEKTFTYGRASGSSVAQTSDGGYIILGSAMSNSIKLDVFLVKTDSKGNKIWQKTFGGNKDDWGESIAQTNDGGYIIVGGTSSFGAGGNDVYLVKTDAQGNILWQKTFGGKNDDAGFSIDQTSDGGYIIVGETHSLGKGKSDVYLVKTDAQGNILWQKTFGGKAEDEGRCVAQTRDGGYILVGKTCSFGAGGCDVYLIKTDGKGNKIWEKTFGGGSDDEGNSVIQTKDGGYIIVGSTLSFGAGLRDIYLIKTDSKGNKIWQKTFGGEGSEEGASVTQTGDGGYIIVGTTDSFGEAEFNVYCIKTDSRGNVYWRENYREQPLGNKSTQEPGR
jgi:hypothetical protein